MRVAVSSETRLTVSLLTPPSRQIWEKLQSLSRNSPSSPWGKFEADWCIRRPQWRVAWGRRVTSLSESLQYETSSVGRELAPLTT